MNEGQIYDSGFFRAVKSKKNFYSRPTGTTSDVGSHLTNVFHQSFVYFTISDYRRGGK